MKRLTIALCLAFVLGACAGPGETSDVAAPPTAAAFTPPATAEPTVAPTEAQILATAAPTGGVAAASETPAPTVTVGPTPTLRPGLEANDPGTFVLAAGQPQFVHFFAFW